MEVPYSVRKVLPLLDLPFRIKMLIQDWGPRVPSPSVHSSSPKPTVTALSASSEGFARRLVCLVQDSKDIERCEVYLRVHVFAPRADDAKVGFGSKLQIRDFLASNKNVSTSAPSRSGQGSLTMYSKARKGLLHSVRGMRSSQTKLSIHAPGGGKDTFDGWLLQSRYNRYQHIASLQGEDRYGFRLNHSGASKVISAIFKRQFGQVQAQPGRSFP